jgi:dTDP-glucose 4,6-dehydratase
MHNKRAIITGGAGFIGSELVRQLISETSCSIYNIDSLSYAADLSSLNTIKDSKRYTFIKEDIKNYQNIENIILDIKPHYIIHLAAESHVDRSIDNPREFIDTNIIGTYNLLKASLIHTKNSTEDFRFHHVSTDEVYGSLEEEGFFYETSPYDPNSPYSASKAASDHFVRAWNRTYKLPITISNCSNNYGPYQHKEKLIPMVITNALKGNNIPVYGKGENIRDWIHVSDHVRAIRKIITEAKSGQTYNIGGNTCISNIEIINMICSILDELKKPKQSHKHLISFVKDRPGHDFRYAIANDKINKDLGWKPNIRFQEGIHKTILWYINQHNKQDM